MIRALKPQVNALLVSYPKSGRTWLRFLLANYLSDFFDLGLTIDLHNMFWLAPNFDSDKVRGIPAFKSKSWSKSIPLVASSHLRYSRWTFGGCKTIFMARDPRDVLVSAYFHETRHKRRFSGNMGEFLRDEMHGLPALVKYFNSWSPMVIQPGHVIVTYEGLSARPEQ